jgi:hypothetical protein
MSARNLPGVGAIRPGDLSAYLLGAGWTRVGDDPWGAAIFTRTVAVPPDPEDKDLPPWEEVRVRVLSDTSLSDYDQRMGEVVDRLAQVEGRPALLVLNDLLLPPADIARFRVHGEGMASGAVSLLAGVRLRQAIGQLVLAAAHSALQPRSHHPRLSLGPAMELLHRCVEGPYERSSFVASVVVPVPPAIGSELDEDPYPRRVTRVLMEGLQAAAQAVEQGNPGSLLDLSARGVSANFLEALSELAPPSDRAVVEATVSWSRTRPTPATTPARVQLRAESFSAFAEAARVLRARRVVPGTELVGFVVSVSRPDNDLTQPGTVMLACDLDGVEGPTKVRMTLPSSSYQQAVEAHARAGRVRATGTLYKSGRSWSLQDVSAFEALPSTDDG